MSFAAAEPLLQALLYEGHLLYPYRPSALKNKERWLFGRLLPRGYCLTGNNAESWRLQAECLVQGTPWTTLEVSLRFLQLATPGDSGDGDRGDGDYGDTVERDVRSTVSIEQTIRSSVHVEFAFPLELQGTLTLFTSEASPGVFKVTIAVENHSDHAASETFEQA